MRRELKKILRANRDALVASQMTLGDIFTIMFRCRDNVLWEQNDGFRITKQTYGEVHDRICRAAGALYARLGATHRYVALELENGPDWIVAFWAILMSGNKPYLVNMRYPQALSQGILNTLGIRHVVCQGGSQLEAEVIAVDTLEGSFPAVPPEVFEDEIAFSSSATSMNEVVCFYSGCQIARQILNFDRIVKEGPRIAKHYKGSLKQLAFLPFYHVFGLFAVYFWFTFFGRTLVFLRDYSADTILKTIRRHQVTHIFAVPMLWHTVEQQVWAAAREQGEAAEKKLRKGLKLMTALQNLLPGIGPEIAKRALSQVTDRLFGKSVMFCINGGSYLRESAMALMNGLGYCMHNGYGMSEIGITSVELGHTPRLRNQNTVGKPFSSVEYRLDEEGILQVRGSSVCKRKLVNGRELLLDGWFDTGDRMTCRDGRYSILGRKSDVVIGENGENINPDTVEKHFSLPGAGMLCVLGLPGQQGQELSLVVQLKSYATQESAQALAEQAYEINRSIPDTMAVKKFYFTRQELAPPTAVKVSRAQVLKKLEQGELELIPFAQLRIAGSEEGEMTPLMLQVQKIMAAQLGIEPEKVTPQAHIFYDLGGSSIQYFSVLTDLARTFGISGFDKNQASCYTLAALSEYIERHL